MTTKKDTRNTIKKPQNFDIKRGQEAIEKVIRDNTEWLKEMAKK